MNNTKLRYLTRSTLDLKKKNISDIIEKQNSNRDSSANKNNTNTMAEPVTKEQLEIILAKMNRSQSHISALNPTTYGGRTNENCTEWLRKFETYTELHKIVDNREKILIFSALLNSGAHCWFINLPKEKKEDWEVLRKAFIDAYQESNKWICQNKIEQRKLKPTESCDRYIEHMTELSLLAEMTEVELSKALIRGLPDDLKHQVIIHNPKTIQDTIERILLAESTYQWVNKEQCNTLEDRLNNHRINDNIEKLTEKLHEMQTSLEECKKELSSKKEDNIRSVYPPCRYCGRNNHPESNCFRQKSYPERRAYNRGNNRQYSRRYQQYSQERQHGQQQQYGRQQQQYVPQQQWQNPGQNGEQYYGSQLSKN